MEKKIKKQERLCPKNITLAGYYRIRQSYQKTKTLSRVVSTKKAEPSAFLIKRDARSLYQAGKKNKNDFAAYENKESKKQERHCCAESHGKYTSQKNK